MKNYTIQMENYTIQMEKIKYCNVWHAIFNNCNHSQTIIKMSIMLRSCVQWMLMYMLFIYEL
jgi:hypothetical protein